MEKEIIYWTLGFIGGYVLLRLIAGAILRKKMKSEPDPFFDVLTNEKYKVKGQWERQD